MLNIEIPSTIKEQLDKNQLEKRCQKINKELLVKIYLEKRKNQKKLKKNLMKIVID